MSHKPNFKELLSLDRDNAASAEDQALISKLLASDDSLAEDKQEFNMSLDFLRSAAFEDEDVQVDDTFNGRVLRRHRVDEKNRSWASFTPAIIGAVTAAVGLIAIIQVVSAPVINNSVELQNQKAELEPTSFPVIPDYTE